MSMNKLHSRIMYGPQTSAYATAGTPTTVLARVQRFTPRRENKFIYDRGVGEGFNAVATYLGTYTSGGTVEYNPVDFDFLKHWVGPKSGAGSVGDPYVLTEDEIVGLTSGDVQVFSLENANTSESTDTTTTFIGCVGDSFELSGAIGGKLSCSATFVARHDVPGTSPTAYTPVTGNAFIILGSTYSWGATPSAITSIQSFTLKYSNGLIAEENRDIDSRFIDIPVIGGRTYTFSFVIKMTSSLAATLITDFYGQASGGPVTGSSSSNPTTDLEFKVALSNGVKNAVFWLDQCSIDSVSDPFDVGGGLVLLTVNCTALYGKSNTPVKWWST